MLTPSLPDAVGPTDQEEMIPGGSARNRLTLLRLRTRFARPSTASPLHVGAALWTGWVVWATTGPVNDVDSYWHVLVGQDILRRHTVDGLGTSWLADPAPAWRTSQWLAEVGMAQIVQHWGWRGLIAVRILLVAATLAVLARTLLPRRPALLAVPVFLATSFTLISVAQDRPQTVSVLGIALLAGVCARLLSSGERPRWLLLGLGSLIWAQIHPLWILAPVAFAFLAAAHLADGRPGLTRARTAGLCAAVSLTGLISPQGVDAFLLPFRFREAAGLIMEWRPTVLTADFAMAWIALVALTLVAWARTPRPIPRSEIVWAVGWWGFGALALRDVVPSALLIAPVALLAAERAWGAAVAQRMPGRTGQWEGRMLRLGTVLALLPGLVMAGQELARLDPLRNTPAVNLARTLAQQPQPLRVFNTSDAGGALAAFSEGKALLLVDGRADLWGGRYVEQVVDAQSLRGDWEAVVTRFRPDAFVLHERAPLAVLLQREGRWRVAARDDAYVLLLPAAG